MTKYQSGRGQVQYWNPSPKISDLAEQIESDFNFQMPLKDPGPIRTPKWRQNGIDDAGRRPSPPQARRTGRRLLAISEPPATAAPRSRPHISPFNYGPPSEIPPPEVASKWHCRVGCRPHAKPAAGAHQRLLSPLPLPRRAPDRIDPSPEAVLMKSLPLGGEYLASWVEKAILTMEQPTSQRSRQASLKSVYFGSNEGRGPVTVPSVQPWLTLVQTGSAGPEV